MLRAAFSTALVSALTALASADVIDFTEVAPGTAIHGETIGNASFSFEFEDPQQATVEVDGGPLDGPFGEAPFLIGDIDGVVQIDFLVPVDSVAYDFVINDTIMSSVLSVLEVFDAGGNSLGTVTQHPQAQIIWPTLADAAGGHVAIDGVGAISSARISYAFLVFSTTFALDNICFDLSGDVTGDGVVDVDDLLAVLMSWGPCRPGVCDADLDDSGEVDVDDLLEVLQHWSS